MADRSRCLVPDGRDTRIASGLQVAVQLEQLDRPSDLPALREMHVDLADAGFVKAQPGIEKAKKAAKRAVKQQQQDVAFRRFATPGGLAVLVGRNSRQNDMLTMRMAQPADLWFHARGVPGAHVLLRTGGKAAGEADIQVAADLAAFFSKARSELKADITMCREPNKNITKFPGARVGQVLVRKEEVVCGRPDRCAAAGQE